MDKRLLAVIEEKGYCINVKDSKTFVSLYWSIVDDFYFLFK